MAEFSPRARTLLELSEKYLFREAEKVLFGVDLRDSVGLSGVTQLDLQRMFATYAFEGGVPWMEAPLDGLFLFETVALFEPFLSLLVRDRYTGRLWGLYVNASLDRLSDPKRNLAVLQYQVFARPTGETQRSSLPAVASLQADIESVLEVKRGQLTPQTESRLNGLLYWLGEWREGVLDFDAFTFWMTKANLLRIATAFKDYTPDLEALLERLQRSVFAIAKKGQLGWIYGPWKPMRRAAREVKGFFVLAKLLPKEKEAERLRKRREAHEKAVKRGRLILAQRAAPDLSNRCGHCGKLFDYPETIREEWLGSSRVKIAYHRECAEKLREETEGPSLDDGPEREDETPEQNLLRPARPGKNFTRTGERREKHRGGYSSKEKCCWSAVIRRIAKKLVEAAVPAPQPEPDAYYEKKKGCLFPLAEGLVAAFPPPEDLQKGGEVTPEGFPDAESLLPRLNPGHPRGIAQEIIDRVRGWTVAALIPVAHKGKSVKTVPFSDLEAKDEDEEAWSEALTFERFLAATPGAASPLTPTNCILYYRKNVVKAPNLELQVWLREREIALSTVWPTLTQMQQELLMWVRRHRTDAAGNDLPMSGKELQRKCRARVDAKKLCRRELKEVQREHRLTHPRFYPDEIDVEVKQLLVAEECRGRKPDTCSGEKFAVAVIREKTFPAPPAACWVWEAGKPTPEEIRWAWRLVCGEIPYKTKVVQMCGNLRCVNPDHLTLDPKPKRTKQRKPPELTRGDGPLVKIEARRGLFYNGRRYEQGAQFYARQIVAEAAVKVGAVALLEGVSPGSHGGGIDGRCPPWGST